MLGVQKVSTSGSKSNLSIPDSSSKSDSSIVDSGSKSNLSIPGSKKKKIRKGRSRDGGASSSDDEASPLYKNFIRVCLNQHLASDMMNFFLHQPVYSLISFVS